MAFPETVDVVFAASDPVLSAELNKVFQAIVGDLHPGRDVLIGPGAWQPKIGGRGAGLAPPVLEDSQWVYNGAGNSILVADVPVPVGHEIQHIRWYYTRGGAGTITRAVYSRDVATGGAEAAATGPTADNAGAAWAGALDSSLGIVRAAGVIYTLEVKLDNAAHVFGGAVVTYRKLP